MVGGWGEVLPGEGISLDGLRASDLPGLPLFFELGLGLVLQPPDVLHGHPEPPVSPAEHL